MVPMLPVMTNHHVVMGSHVVTQNGPAVPHAQHHVPNAQHMHVQAAHQVAAQQHQSSLAAAHAAMQHQQQQHQQHQHHPHQQQHIINQNNQSNQQSHQVPVVPGSTLSPHAHSSNTSNQNSSSEGNSKKTPKEKTPMCQVNEIAKYNKLTPKYTLTAEEGPPHHKTFTVTLDMGQKETWQGTGTSIKKAQHAAAKNAIEQCTSLEKPKYKPKRPKAVNVDALTPTVKLNGLAMKRGVMAAYKMVDRKPVYPNNSQFPDGVPQIYPNAPNGAKTRNTRVPKLFVVELNVGTQIIVCEGRTRQQARHAAAEKALAYFEANLAPEKKPPRTIENPANAGGGQGGGNRSSGDNKTENSSTEKSTPGPKKSEVSLVYELALKRNLPVHFEKLAEEGPPHLKHYSMRLHVGKTPDDLAKEKAGEVPKRQEGEAK
jgi:double-stranded RNA-binding protein Staufen